MNELVKEYIFPEVSDAVISSIQMKCRYSAHDYPPKKEDIDNFMTALQAIRDLTFFESDGEVNLLRYIVSILENEVADYDEDFLSKFFEDVEEIYQALYGKKVEKRGTGNKLPLGYDISSIELIKLFRLKNPDASKLAVNFRDDDVYLPNNGFTKWFCDAMRKIHPDIPQASLRTLIKRHRNNKPTFS